MALQIVNATPFACQKMALLAKNGATVLRIVVKATFDIQPDGHTSVCAEQAEAVMADVHWGKPGESSVRYESDVILGKPGTDLIVHGEAWSPSGEPVDEMDVALGYQGRLIKQLRVTGDRTWGHSVLGWRLSGPAPFVRMPVVYDRAYGGSDAQGSEPRNRSGMGYASVLNAEADGMPAPNIEFPDQLIRTTSDRPLPAGLGVVSRHWVPRLGFAGTYDDAWLENRHPLLPHDFDERYFHSVTPDQWIPAPQGGEQIAVRGMTPEGMLRCILPPCDMPLRLKYRDATHTVAMHIETVLLDASQKRLTLTWGATADIHGDPFRLLEIGLGAPVNKQTCCPTC